MYSDYQKLVACMKLDFQFVISLIMWSIFFFDDDESFAVTDAIVLSL